MARLMITENQVQALRETEHGSQVRKSVWAGIRRSFGIPGDIKIGVETDPYMPNYRELYVKGSEPRRYLLARTFSNGGWASFGGVEDGTAQTATPQAAATPAAQTAAPTPSGGRFVRVSDSDQASPCKVDKAALLDLLNRALDDGDLSCDCNPRLPQDFPTMKPGGVVLDSLTGDLYFIPENITA